MLVLCSHLCRQPTFHGVLGQQFGVAPKIWEAARGSSAAPTYFEPLVLSMVISFVVHICSISYRSYRSPCPAGGFCRWGNGMQQSHRSSNLWSKVIVAWRYHRYALYVPFCVSYCRPDCVVSLGTGSNLEKQIKAMKDTNDGVFKAVSKIAVESGLVWGANAVDIATCSECTHWQVRNWLSMGRDTAYHLCYNTPPLLTLIIPDISVLTHRIWTTT